jgi:hypothetical protein
MASPVLASATPLLALCALACPVGMGAMMWFMARGSRSDRATQERPPTERAEPTGPTASGEPVDLAAAGARDTLQR